MGVVGGGTRAQKCGPTGHLRAVSGKNGPLAILVLSFAIPQSRRRRLTLTEADGRLSRRGILSNYPATCHHKCRVASTADTLTAIGGLGAFGASVVLAVLAFFQMRATRIQSRAALEQAQTARHQAEITKEAAARQIYPLVYAHEWKGPKWDGDEEAFAMRYYLSNEGLGPALNVEHGVRVGSVEFHFGHEGPYMFRSIQPGEFLPPLGDEASDPVPSIPITRLITRDEYYGTGEAAVHKRPQELVYWCRYENLFGDRWETLNSSNPTKRPGVRRLEVTQTAKQAPTR